MRSVFALAGAILAVSVLSSSAGASAGTGGWTITKSSGNTFSGTFTNETASPINGVAIGTADKAANPITAFTINAIVCQLYASYGSAYCYTALLIQPGATVVFHGTSQKALPPAGLQMCTSADRGMDNTCSDVALAKAKAQATKSKKSKKSSVTRATTPRKQAAAAAFEEVLKAISEEADALDDLNAGHTHAAQQDLSRALYRLRNALVEPFDAPDIAGDLKSAQRDDEDAYNDLGGTKPGKISRARTLITDAQAKKHASALDLNHIAHA